MKWNKPPEEWFKLNTNGASSGNLGKAGGNGRWIKGFSRSIGHASSFVAKYWALRDGFKLALGIGVQRLVVELDAKVVVSLITSIGGSNKPYLPLLNDCRYLLSRFLQTRVVHVFREGNRCADALARMGSNMTKECLIILLVLMFCILSIWMLQVFCIIGLLTLYSLIGWDSFVGISP